MWGLLFCINFKSIRTYNFTITRIFIEIFIMTTKLTLSIDEEKVKKIKRFSKEKGVSISKIVEEHIDHITSKTPGEKLDIMKIKGAFGKVPKGFDWKKVKTDHLLKKYVK